MTTQRFTLIPETAPLGPAILDTTNLRIITFNPGADTAATAEHLNSGEWSADSFTWLQLAIDWNVR